MWGAGDYGDQTPMPRRGSTAAGTDYAGADATAPRTAQRTVSSSYLFPSTPYNPASRGNLGGQDRSRSREGGMEDAYTLGATPARGRFTDVGGSTPGVFGMTPTAAGYTPFRRPAVEERTAAPLTTSPTDRTAGEEQPPARSLYDELEEEDAGGAQTTHMSEAMFMGSPVGEGSDVESGTWVTVFGFPPSQASYVLKLFQDIGEVVRHKTPLGQCNWMHIQFQTKTQARHALARNGKTFGGNLMVGVMECTDATAQATGSALSEFPRPLNAPVQPKLGSHEVDIFGPKIPKRSDSAWSRFMEYVVGV